MFKYADGVYSQLNVIIIITGAESPSAQYLQPHGACAPGTPHFRFSCSGVTRVCTAQGGLNNCSSVFLKEIF